MDTTTPQSENKGLSNNVPVRDPLNEDLSIDPTPQPQKQNPLVKETRDPGVTLPPNAQPLETLRTYHGDVAEAVKNQQASVFKIALAESKKRNRDGLATTVAETQKKNALYVFLSAVLILAGISAFVYLFYFAALRSVHVPPDPLKQYMLAADAEERLDITGKAPGAALSALKDSLAAKSANGRIEVVQPIEMIPNEDPKKDPVAALIDAKRFFGMVGGAVPAQLIRSLQNDFILGIRGVQGGEPFMILKTTSFDIAFGGMLNWEDTMAEDLEAFLPFPPVAPSVAAPIATSTATTTATTTPQQPAPQEENLIFGFTDLIVANRDTRIQKNSDGSTKLIYTFNDKSTIVIATSIETLRELLPRVAAPATQPR